MSYRRGPAPGPPGGGRRAPGPPGGRRGAPPGPPQDDYNDQGYDDGYDEYNDQGYDDGYDDGYDNGGGGGRSNLTNAVEQANQEAMQHNGWKEMKTADGGEYYYNIITEDVTWDKPRELETEEEAAREGDWYWVPDDFEGFIPAKKLGQAGRGNIQFQKEDGMTFNLPAGEAKLLDPMNWTQLRTKTNDLVMLDVMNVPLIMYNLKKRFENNEIYTNVGTILISCNPYKRLPLYTSEVIESYMRKGSRRMPPHVFDIADNAYRGLREWNVGQSIVISGESGAGKTECTKQALQYLAEIAGSATNNVEQKILSSNPILEAFGNAKTVRNNNSSRFGKYMEVLFNNRSQICGASIKNYLLEKIRVVMQAEGERNFHIFFQLCLGADSSMKSSLKLGNIDDYYYINTQDPSCPGMDDVEEFHEVVRAMQVMGFSEQEKTDVFRIVSAVLSLGNIHFKSTGDRKCDVKDRSTLSKAAEVCKLDSKGLHKVVTTRTMRVRGQAPITVPLGKDQAEAARDALAKFIYNKNFNWIVNRLAKSIGRGDAAKDKIIGILDIFGFEIFKSNQFEQLCINFANEKLQQFFNAHTFKKEEEVYRFEKIKFDHVEYIDNQPVLDLIEKRPHGILVLVDEEIRVPKGTDQTYIKKVKSLHTKTKEFKTILKRPEHFIVKHYAGDVEYETKDFLDKNRDTLLEDAYNLLSNSNFTFLAKLFPSDKSTSRKTLGAKFSGQLNALMNALNATEPHYIRCIKPNPNKAPMEFHGKMSMLQLKYSGVFEAVKIRKQGFPFRLTHRQFWLRYKCIMPRTHNWGRNTVENCRFLIHQMKQDTKTVQIGETRILYRATPHRNMELRRNLAVEQVAIHIQKYARRACAKLLEIRCIQIKPVIAAALATRDIGKVTEALEKAANVGFDTAEILEAKRMKFAFEEEKRLIPVFQMLIPQDPHELYADYEAAVRSADDIGMDHPDANRAREIFHVAEDERHQLEKDAEEQLELLDEDVIADVIQRASDFWYESDTVDQLRTMLYEYSEEKFAKLQLKAAVMINDPNRITKRTIKLKEIFFQKSGDQFIFRKYPHLVPPIAWANKKFLAIHKDQLATGMLSWNRKIVHAPLTQIDAKDKANYKNALKCAKSIMGYMGDKKMSYPDMLAEEVLKTGLDSKVLRDEIYCLIMKQVSSNPDRESSMKGWNLMLLCLHTFPPTARFDNYLECFIRTFAPEPRRKYLFKLHGTLYGGAKPVAPSAGEMGTILAYQPPEDDTPKIPKQPPARRVRGQGRGGGGGSRRPAGGAPSAPSRRPGGPPGAPPSAPGGGGGGGGAAAAPEMDMDIEWYYVDTSEAQVGPVTVADIRDAVNSEEIYTDALVWNEDMEEWAAIEDIPELMDYLNY